MIEWFKNLSETWQVAIFTVGVPILIGIIGGLFKFFKWLFNKRGETSAAQKAVQQTGNGNTTIIAEGNRGNIAGRDIIVNSDSDIQSIFDEVVKLLNTGEPRVAQVWLEKLWEHQNDKMTSRQKSNCIRLLGCSFDGQDEPEKAGRYFLKAKDYDPEWEKARASESLGYFCLGNPAKAHELAEAVLRDYRQNTVAWSVLIRTDTDCYCNILKRVPSHLHNDAEVATALAAKAAEDEKFDIAREHLECALKEVPGNPRVIEKLACILIGMANINEIFLYQRDPTQKEKRLLEEAIELYTESIEKFQKESKTKSAAYTLVKLATAHKALLNRTQANDCLRQAYKIASNESEIVYWYAIDLAQDDLNEAISLLKNITNSNERCDIEFVLAQMLKQRNSCSDIKDAIRILQDKVGDLANMPHDFKCDYLELLFELRLRDESLDQIGPDFQQFVLNSIDNVSKQILWASLLQISNKIPASVEKAKSCLEQLNQSVTYHDQRRLATLFQKLGLHKEALCIWKSIVIPEYFGQDTFHLLSCAERCEDVRFIIDFSKGLRSNGVWNRKVFELELHCHELYNDLEGAIDLLQEHLLDPKDETFTPYVRLRLSAIGIRTNRLDIIERDISKLPAFNEVDPSIGRLVVNVLRYGNNCQESLEYAYNLLRLHWDASEAHIAMMELLLTGSPRISLTDPECVIKGSAVLYMEDDTGNSNWHIIEDSSFPEPDQFRNEYALTHPLSQALLGKKEGDSFILRKSELQNRTATVRKICSKYLYRSSDCLENFESRFQENSAIQKIIAIDKTGKFDISPVQKMAEKDAEVVEKLEELYATQPFPVYSFAIKKGRSIVEAMNHIVCNPNLKFICCVGTDQEEIEAERRIKDASEIVLDASAITTLLFINSYQSIIETPYKYIVSQGTINSFRQLNCLHTDPEATIGSYSKNGFRPISREDILKEKKELTDIIDFIESNCRIVDGLVVADLEKSQRDVLITIMGRDCLESMLLAAQAGRVLWTDDMATAALAQNEFGCYRTWTQFFFSQCLNNDFNENRLFQDITVQLMQMGYYYTKPTIDTFMLAIEKSNNNLDHAPAFQVFNWFSDPNVTPQGHLFVAANVIKKVWQEINMDSICQSVTIRILERLSQRQKGYVAIEVLNQITTQLFGLDVLNEKKAKDTIEGWLNGTQPGRIILP